MRHPGRPATPGDPPGTPRKGKKKPRPTLTPIRPTPDARRPRDLGIPTSSTERETSTHRLRRVDVRPPDPSELSPEHPDPRP